MTNVLPYTGSSVRFPLRATVATRVRSMIYELKAAAFAGNKDRAETLSHDLELLTSAYMEPQPAEPFHELSGLKLTKSERRLVDILSTRAGKVISRSAIMDALYYDEPEVPGPKIVDVFVCKARRKLKGTRYEIENAWGEGYKLVLAETKPVN